MGKKNSKSPGNRVEHSIPPEKRLTTKWYKPEDCEAAIQGERLPQAVGDEATQACVVRGIRFHHGFAEELRGTLPIFTRALNARDIMSNIIPDMQSKEEYPYCIWYPEVASEETYRKLATQYPSLRYNIGRACAVAGYKALLDELRLLPEVHIAEEAFDNNNHDIFEAIMSHPIKFEVMNDYTRDVHEDNPAEAVLNSETAVRSLLVERRRQDRYVPRLYFNITEDYNVDMADAPSPKAVERRTTTLRLLYTQLPRDLPPCDRDLLLYSAAYYGDIDRYIRLRRPPQFIVASEESCVRRGIYHNTMFAKWWTTQPFKSGNISSAITARFIMNGDLSCINESTPATHIPYCIWWPQVPEASVLAALAEIRPDMKLQIARACIVLGSHFVWDSLNSPPDGALCAEARDSPDPYFLQDLERKLAQVRSTPAEAIMNYRPEWKLITRRNAFERRGLYILQNASANDIDAEAQTMMDGSWTSLGPIELHVSGLKDPTTVTGGERVDEGNELTRWLQDKWEYGRIFMRDLYWEWVQAKQAAAGKLSAEGNP